MRKDELIQGWKDGIPICLGYFGVSMAFGMMAVLGGIPLWAAVVISLTNLTSAGQFAGTNLILAGGGYVEMAITQLVINIRYFLMSLSLSQKVEEQMGGMKRLAVSFGITDEIFAAAMQRRGELTTPYMAGLIIGPVMGWTGGTFFGGAVTSLLPDIVTHALGIALYGMFIAVVIPAAKKEGPVFFTAAAAVLISCLFYYVPAFSFLTGGWGIIAVTLIASSLAALFFPIDSREKEEV